MSARYAHWCRVLWPIPINNTTFLESATEHDFALLCAGDKISFLRTPADIQTGFVEHPVCDVPYGHASCARFTVRWLRSIPFHYWDEGLQWCRGWDGPDVDAFKTAVALR